MRKLPKRFKTARLLGEGAVGTVYEVWDEVRSERLALKTLHKLTGERANPGAVRGFKQEFRNVASVSHENLVVLHELFFEDELWFFTMELVRGKPFLGTRTVAPAARLAPAPLRDRFAQLARGINALHQVDVVHRDIKPQNVLVEAGGRVVLLDFGMVTPLRGRAHEVAYSSGFAGSPGYVAPEQVFGESLTFASDWYSFGCVLYEALTGLLPFEDGREAILMRKLSHAPTPPSQLVPDVPEDLEQLCLGLLERKPERRPDAREVLCGLGEAGPISRPSVVPSSRQQARVFVGREPERRAIGAWLRSGGGLRPRVTVLSGPSGIGKTTLAEAVIAELRGRDALVLRSRCLKQEVVPFNAWDSLIDELSRLLERPEPPRAALRMDPALPRLFPVLARAQEAGADAATLLSDPVEIRSEGVRALRELFLELGAEQPVRLFIDDIQWADADSVRLLRELVLGTGAPPLEVLVTLRPGTGEGTRIEALLAEPELDGLCRKFVVGPLPPAESMALLDSLVQLEGPARAAVLAEAEGNPFLIAELARDAEQLGDPARILLTEVLAERLGKLTPQARALFEMIAVLGRPLPFHVALGAAGISGQALEDLHRLRALGLIRWGGLESEEEVEVYHDRWRAALDARLGTERRRECFAALAEAYARRGRAALDAEVLAHCYQESGEPELAARHALTAARGAEAALAFEKAANAYEKALELGSWQTDERLELFTRLGEMANAAGRGALAGRAFADAVTLAAPRAQLDLQRRAAQAFMSSGHQQEGERILLDVLRAVGRPPLASRAAAIGVYLLERWKLRRRGLERRPRPLQPRARERVEAADLAATLWMHHDPVASWTYAMRELRWLLDADDDRLLLRALCRELVFAATEPLNADWIEALSTLGDALVGETRSPRRVSPNVKEAPNAEMPIWPGSPCPSPAQRGRGEPGTDLGHEALVPRVDDPAVVALYRSAQALRTFLAGDWAKATREAREAEQMLRTRCTGVHWELAWVRRVYVAAIQIEGDMLAAEPLIQAWLEDAEQRDDREGIVTHLLGLGYCHLCRNEPGLIAPLARRLSSLVGSAHSGAVNIAWIEAFTLCYERAPPAALAEVLARIQRVHHTEHGRVLLYRVWSRGYEGRLLAALATATAGSERQRWIRELRRLERLLAREGWSYASSEAKNIEATLAWLAGDAERAARALEESARISTRTGARLFAAVARLARARVQADEVSRERASAALRALNVADVDRMARAHLPAFWGAGVDVLSIVK